MRELKFRHYNLFTNEMHYSEKDFHCLEHYFSNREYDSSDEMQFTGLKDKNGVDIYEGDIVKSKPRCGRGVGTFKVSYDNIYGSFVCHFISWSHCNLTSPESYPLGEARFNIEVIGNKYENPELLESK